MSTHTNDRRSAAPQHPDASPAGPHLVIDKTEWVPGAHPDPHRRSDGQRAYRDSYYRCIVCGEERQATEYFSDRCEGGPTARSA